METEGRPVAVETVMVYSASLSLSREMKYTQLLPHMRLLIFEVKVALSGVVTEWNCGP